MCQGLHPHSMFTMKAYRKDRQPELPQHLECICMSEQCTLQVVCAHVWQMPDRMMLTACPAMDTQQPLNATITFRPPQLQNVVR